MLLFVFTRLGILMLEDEVNLDLNVRLSHLTMDPKEVVFVKITLLVDPHLSGPNMITYGEALENSSACRALLSLSSLRYAPPHSRPSASRNQPGLVDIHCPRAFTLKLDFILYHQRLPLIVDLLGELGRDGMMGRLVLHHQALVAFYPFEHMRFFDGPLANVRPLLVGLFILLVLFLLSMRGRPSRVPVIGELFDKGALQVGWLITETSTGQQRRIRHRRVYSR